MITDDTLANRILVSRKDLGLTQHQLAERAKVSRSYIGNLEKGVVTNIGRYKALALANALGISIDYLLGKEEDPLHGLPDEEEEEENDTGSQKTRITEANAAYTVAHPEIELLITIYKLLNSEKRQILLNMAKVLRDAETPHIVGGDPGQATPPHQDRTSPPT
ncbi:MAG: helix-turn-helix domain-containing protein [Nitrospiraceae bacterium]